VQQSSPPGPGLGQLDPTGGENPPLGLDGFCPVTLVKTSQWKQGDVRYGAVHRGRTYLFAGPEERKQFFERPDDWSPVLSGYDPVEYLDNGRMVSGHRAHGLEYGRHMFLFSSEATLEKFASSPRRYAIGVFQAMQQGPR
jgi:YHS domain-containing protein